MDLTPEQIKLMEIFFPYAFARQCAVRDENIRFVHYTRADAAMKILKSKTVWMRKTSCMRDFTEVQHGLECLKAAYNGEIGGQLKTELNRMFNGVAKEIEDLFNGWEPYLCSDTYITCFSEHLDSEDSFGRLSMWRAFSGSTGVAFVFNNTVFLTRSDALKAYSSPVSYLDKGGFGTELGKVTEALKDNFDFVRAQGQETIINFLFRSFMFGTLCTKHPGFNEEKEWRAIYVPKMGKSEHLSMDIEVIGSTPQPVYKIPLRNIPEEGLVGVAIPELIERIIIGPTEYPIAIREAFETLLGEAGVDDPGRRVHVSEIPLRL